MGSTAASPGAAEGPTSGNPGVSGRCQACASDRVRVERVACRAPAACGREVTFAVCERCGLTVAPDNVHAYTNPESFLPGDTPGEQMRPRVGDGQHPGREYYMAALGVAGLGLKKPNVLVFGSGLSLDYLLIEKKFCVSRVAVCDLDNFTHAPDFIDIAANQTFDIVIASEVIEHFTDFERDFRHLFSKRDDKGIVIAGTNLNDGTPLGRVLYPFEPGHTAYHTGTSLAFVARRHGLAVDFRTPHAAIDGAGPRKRYVIFGKPRQLLRVARYFARHPFAPSEKPLPKHALG